MLIHRYTHTNTCTVEPPFMVTLVIQPPGPDGDVNSEVALYTDVLVPL